MSKYISFSGGVESTTMCLLYGEGATAIWCDTGSEHALMYERIDHVEQMLKEHHKGNFTLVRIRANVTVGDEKVDSLTDYIIARKFMPSPRQRFCTRLFKIQPIDLFLSAQGDCELMIGLNADEAENRTGNHGLQPNVNYSYPLVDAGMDRADCIEILEHYGLMPDFPPYMDRGGCKFCPFKSKKEYAAMVHFALAEIEEVRELEEHIQDNRNKYFRIRSNMPRLRDFIATEKNNLIGNLSQYYAADTEQKSCGVFCHR
jgi:3'-phosphoadenosine 5'-phosphosulfate sulfotransferase (PAPS reductase)/FAD synthetase